MRTEKQILSHARQVLQDSIEFRTSVVKLIHRDISDGTKNHKEEDEWWSTRIHRDYRLYSTKYTCGSRRYGVHIK